MSPRPSRRPLLGLVARIDRGLSGVVRGQLIICLVNGVLSAIGFAIVGLKYWPVMALVATVFSLVPIFGSIASSVPAVALGLTQSPGVAFFALQALYLVLNPVVIATGRRTWSLMATNVSLLVQLAMIVSFWGELTLQILAASMIAGQFVLVAMLIFGNVSARKLA